MTIFEKIVQGEIPSYKIAENEDFMAFLDVNPVKKGHTLVIPKRAVDYIFDLEDQTLADLNVFAKKVAIGIKKVIPCLRIGVAVVGLEVPHVHIHLIPMDQIADLSFSNPRVSMTENEFEELRREISSALS